MAGTLEGGLKAAKTNRKKYGKNFYRDIGRIGGNSPKTKPCGFQTMPHERLIKISSMQGHTSKRGYKRLFYDEETGSAGYIKQGRSFEYVVFCGLQYDSSGIPTFTTNKIKLAKRDMKKFVRGGGVYITRFGRKFLGID